MQYYSTIDLHYLIKSELTKLGMKDETKLKIMEYLLKNDLNNNATGWEFVNDEIDFVITNEDDRYKIRYKTIYSPNENIIEVFKEEDEYRTSYLINILTEENTISIISDNDSIIYNMNYTNEGSKNEYIFLNDEKIEKIRFHEYEREGTLLYDHTEYIEEESPESIPNIINNFNKDNKEMRLHK